MKDRKTILYFMIPLMIFLMGAGGNLLFQVLQKAPPPEPQIRVGARAASIEDLQIDLNEATMEDLLGLPGIGETKAERILQYRAEHGGFRSVEELLEVKGIGEKTLEKLRDYVCVED